MTVRRTVSSTVTVFLLAVSYPVARLTEDGYGGPITIACTAIIL